ncbi:MAG: hypothetical protein ABID54_00060 [Pseudomonadota bacterium]
MVEYKKDLWKGNFNYQGQMFELYKYAYSRKHSKWLFMKQLAEEAGVSLTAMQTYFSDPTKDNHYIERITKRGKKRVNSTEMHDVQSG